MRRAELRGVVLLALLGMGVGSCNELSGANQYEQTERCTGPMCGVCPAEQNWDPAREECIACAAGQTWQPGQGTCIDDSVLCSMQGGQWNAEQQECIPSGSCPAGQRWYAATNACIPSCSTGVECGANCCPNGLNCVDEATGHCSVCVNAQQICGAEPEVCCEEGTTCTNPERGVCSSPYGVVSRSCGAGLTCNGESCCESILVPGGTFPMGSPDGEGFSDEHPEHEVTLSAYELDKYEVTVGRFRAFVEGYQVPPAGAGAHPRIAGSGWRGEWNEKLPGDKAELETLLVSCGVGSTWQEGQDTLPINCVNWYEAFAFCAWDGGRLPTEGEWEYAAAGGDENRNYPWGEEEPTPAHPMYDHAAYDCAGGDNDPSSCYISDIVLVGSKPAGAGRWGHQDLAGSMYEWVMDAYGEYEDHLCNDCANTSNVPVRVIRGGSWYDYATSLRAAYRFYSTPTYYDSLFGFRCARTP